MPTATRLYKALSMQMERKFNALSEITDLLDKVDVRYYIPHYLQEEVKIVIYTTGWDGVSFTIEPTLRGYKLIANYSKWQDSTKISIDFKIVERVYPETIVDNIQRIMVNPNHFLKEYHQQKADWKQRRKYLRMNQAIKDLSS